MLPDAASGQDSDTLARKLSRRAPRERSEQRGCKEGEPGSVLGVGFAKTMTSPLIIAPSVLATVFLFKFHGLMFYLVVLNQSY